MKHALMPLIVSLCKAQPWFAAVPENKVWSDER
jgi:hypothetical protein